LFSLRSLPAVVFTAAFTLLATNFNDWQGLVPSGAHGVAPVQLSPGVWLLWGLCALRSARPSTNQRCFAKRWGRKQ
jgi:hypothetical protein